MSPRASHLAIVVSALLLAGCGQEQASTYRVPKEKDPELPVAAASDSGSPAPGSAMADAAVPTASGAVLTWQAPPQWTAKAASAMRKGSYSVPGGGGECDLSVTAFPGDVGGELANVNRWRGQVGLAPLRQEDLEASVSRLEANGLRFTLVELAAPGDPNGKAMLGAIVPFGASTWFFKMSGPGPSVRASRAAFVDFLHSVRASDSAENAAPAPAAPAPAMADSAVPTAAGADLTWQAPPRWAPKAASAMRKASYSVPGDGGECDLSVTAFPGDVGGELANVNRWRGQVGLDPLRQEDLEASVSRLEANGLRFTLVELAAPGDPNGKAMLGAMVPFGASTWFFKMSGPGPTVRASKAAFVDFLHSVRAP